MTTLIKNAIVVTVDSDFTVHNPGAVVIDGSSILDVGASRDVVSRHPACDVVIDANAKILAPGFVSIHNHVGYTVFRGRAEDIGYDSTHRLYLPMAEIITREERTAIGSHAIAELLRGGITTILEMEEDADVFAPFIEKAGIRAGLGIMMSDLSLERLAQGEVAFNPAVRDQQIDQAVQLIEQWHNKADGRIQGYLASTGISTGSRDLLEEIRNQADRLSVRISTHLGFGERELVRKAHGCNQLEMAADVGLLAADVIAVHCYDINEQESRQLAKSGAQLAHCPLMNQFRGEIAPLQTLRENGMNAGLGIDNYFSDFFDLLRACIASARIQARDPRILSASEVLTLGTIGGAKAMGLDDQIGSIEVGKRADLQLINMDQSGLTPVNDPVTTLIYHAHAKDVDTVMIDGKIITHNGELVSINQHDLLVDAGRAADAAWSRFAERYGAYAGPAP